jgi:NAD-dependent deacetylase
MDEEKVLKIAEAIVDSKKTVVLTGAGISTESGIPDFRSPGGIWTRFDPALMNADIIYQNPSYFYRKALPMLEFFEDINSVRPSSAHLILADMEREGLISSIITQNIDSLHIKAGSKKVYEVHGNLKDAHCMTCRKKTDFSSLVEKVKAGIIPPECDSCGGILRPSVILFGDRLPECFTRAIEEVKSCDLLFIIGSSLEVAPVNSLPYLAQRYVILNRDRTSYDRGAYVVLNENAGDGLKAIYNEIKRIIKKN